MVFIMIKVVYNEKQVADPGKQTLELQGYTPSPSAKKPMEVAQQLRSRKNIEFVDPVALSIEDIKLVHDPEYVNGIFSLKLENGFGTISQSVVDSLPYTNGAMYTAAKLATKETPACALVSGFHHAMYHGWKGHGWFCTFNGLMITAAKLLSEGMRKICIIDADMHWGNGTENILMLKPELNVDHLTLGLLFKDASKSEEYLKAFDENNLVDNILSLSPDLIIYQAGADVHVDDPYGGVLTTEQIFERDLRMFRLAKKYNIPICWNLAGGYQVDDDGSIQKVIDIHLNTFDACEKVYGTDSVRVYADHPAEYTKEEYDALINDPLLKTMNEEVRSEIDKEILKDIKNEQSI